VRRNRHLPAGLGTAERRVLDAFYCGRIPAGRVSEALAEARRRQVVQAVVPDPQRPVAAAAPLQVAA
jgi:hypothetical protein